MLLLARLLAKLPLGVLHFLGSILGPVALLVDKRAAKQLGANLTSANAYLGLLIAKNKVAANLGKRIIELPWIWAKSSDELMRYCEIDESSKACVEKPVATIFLTPHLGSFEVAGFYIANVRPITAMYRVPKQKALDALMKQGRKKGMTEIVPADLSGVRAMLQSLRAGKSIGILPDQVPSGGDGQVVPFLGRPARTMSLVHSLALKTKARVVMAIAVWRDGKFVLIYEEINIAMSDQYESLMAMNKALERAIERYPEEYLWTYNRYKGVESNE